MSDQRPTVAILTLGCKLNQADSEMIARRLVSNGVRITDQPLPGADAYIINSCSVTHVAERKARHLVRKVKRLTPGAPVVLTGCYAETASPEFAARTGADPVLRNSEKPSIPDWLLARLTQKRDPAAGCPTPAQSGLRTRNFIKIQEGCNEMCAFCVVPYTRGRERSVPISEVIDEVLKRQAEGVLEVVLTGTQLGNYGRDLGWPEHGPRPLLEALLERTSVPRIRLSSLQAQDISAPLLTLWSDPRLCPHFHLPLQSGSDTVLHHMRRRYSATEYRRAADMIRERIPDVAITTDVIAGFPGETETDFQATLRLLREVSFAAVHCFPYSRRPGTGAAGQEKQLTPPVKRSRLEQLLTAGRASAEEFREKFLGRTLAVLWEQQKGERWQGLTANYIRVYTSADEDMENQIRPTRLLTLEGEGMAGRAEQIAAHCL